MIKQIVYKIPDNNGKLISTNSSKNGLVDASSPSSIQIGNTNILNEDIKQIGIQAPPGTRFKLNQSQITVGRSGLYEIDCVNVSDKINSLIFMGENLHDIIVDYITF